MAAVSPIGVAGSYELRRALRKVLARSADSDWVRHLLLAVVVALTLVACSNRDVEIADRRAVVDEVFETIVWPDGYEQRPEILRTDPNLDSLNTQPGRIFTLFSVDDQTIAEIRDDFHESLTVAGFLVKDESHECSENELDVSYYNSVAMIGTASVTYDPELSPYVGVSFGWTVPTEESIASYETRAPGELPGCPAG